MWSQCWRRVSVQPSCITTQSLTLQKKKKKKALSVCKKLSLKSKFRIICFPKKTKNSATEGWRMTKTKVVRCGSREEHGRESGSQSQRKRPQTALLDSWPRVSGSTAKILVDKSGRIHKYPIILTTKYYKLIYTFKTWLNRWWICIT